VELLIGHNHSWQISTKSVQGLWSYTAASRQNAVLHSGSLITSFHSYCVLYLRNGQTECHHITYNDSTDIVIMHGIVIQIFTIIQVTAFWLDITV